MNCGGCGMPRGREACPTCDGAEARARAIERHERALVHHAAGVEGRRLGQLFRERELREAKIDGVRWTAETMTARAHRADAERAELARQVERLESRLGRALAELRQRDEDDERVIKMAGDALDAVAPVVKPCGYVDPCGKCPSCRFHAALASHRERFPRST